MASLLRRFPIDEFDSYEDLGFPNEFDSLIVDRKGLNHSLIVDDFFEFVSGGSNSFVYTGNVAFTSSVNSSYDKGKVYIGSINLVLVISSSIAKDKVYIGDIIFASTILGILNKGKVYSNSVNFASIVSGVTSSYSIRTYIGQITNISQFNSLFCKGKVFSGDINCQLVEYGHYYTRANPTFVNLPHGKVRFTYNHKSPSRSTNKIILHRPRYGS